ncbi:MAG: inorganic diphosphatase [Candidatus Wildermuthbacteria bacterium]|nr:inorganic diphosphatase [Candidatus Wildermuthbacteria bacterium]MBI2121453.1 inorganic diphosphatase [Candidatus Wildermuthbacteria bacterium]
MTINILVEIPKGSHNKYEVDEESGRIKLDRVLHGATHFPFEYGSVENTRGEDGDPLDVVLLSSAPTFPGCTVKAELIGYLEMEDEGGIDHKMIAVPVAKIDPRWSHIREISDLQEHSRAEIKDFFEIYKRLEPGKWVKTKEFKSRKEAEEILANAQKKYTN